MALVGRLTIATQVMVGLAGAAASLETLVIARRPGLSFAASSTPAGILEASAGWALLLAGILWLRSPARRGLGAALSAAGLTWLMGDWNNTAEQSSLLFTAALVLSAACPAILAHAALRDAAPKLHRFEVWLVVLAYASTLLISGLLPAMMFDPPDQGCYACANNLVALTSDPRVVEQLGRAATVLDAAWPVVIVIGLAIRILRSSPAQRGVVASMGIPAAVYLAAVGLDNIHSIKRGFVGDDVIDHRLRLLQGVALIAVALGSGWALLRRRLTRAAVARLVLDAAAASPDVRLEGSLGATLGDPSLRIRYPMSDGRLVDSAGTERPVPLTSSSTRLVRGATVVAVLVHRKGLLDAEGVADEVTGAARLALDNERLRAEARARLIDLRASRTRVVVAAEDERRRLERDLHDGAQQKVVTLALELQLATLRLDAGKSASRSRLEAARSEVTAALADLREIARGLYPRELADEGLAAGLETLAESSRLVLRSLPEVRCPGPVESAAYFVVAACAQTATAHQLAVAVRSENGRLHVDVETDALPSDFTRLADRVAALEGSIVVERVSAQASAIRVELPCGL